MTSVYKSRVAGGLCLAGVTGVAAAAVALLGPAASAATKAGGDSTGAGSANGGSGGSQSVVETPIAQSGNSGAVNAQSTATNTGNTGPATSTASSNPVAITGNSGPTGATGSVKSSNQSGSTASLSTSQLAIHTPGSGIATSVSGQVSKAKNRIADAVAHIGPPTIVVPVLAAQASTASPPVGPPASNGSSTAVDLAMLGVGMATNSADGVAGLQVRNGGPSGDVPSA